MISYKSIFSFQDNIGFNELPIIAPEKDNNSTLSDSISQFLADDIPLFETSKSKHKRNLSSSVIDSLITTKQRLGNISKKSINRKNSVETKTFEFEDSENYSSSNDNSDVKNDDN